MPKTAKIYHGILPDILAQLDKNKFDDNWDAPAEEFDPADGRGKHNQRIRPAVTSKERVLGALQNNDSITAEWVETNLNIPKKNFFVYISQLKYQRYNIQKVQDKTEFAKGRAPAVYSLVETEEEDEL